MKKIIAIVSSLIIALTFTACGRKSDKGKDSSIGYGSNTNNGSNIGSDLKNGMSNIESATESATDKITNPDNSTNSGNNSAVKIIESEAKAKALKHAGLEEKDITGYEIDTDRDNGKVIYEIDFKSGNTEYSYDINAHTGEIVEREHEIKD